MDYVTSVNGINVLIETDRENDNKKQQEVLAMYAENLKKEKKED